MVGVANSGLSYCISYMQDDIPHRNHKANRLSLLNNSVSYASDKAVRIFFAGAVESAGDSMSDITHNDQIESSETAAAALKNEGNALLVAHKYSSAAEKYSAAIEYHPSSILYSNRAQALIKLESYGLAIDRKSVV